MRSVGRARFLFRASWLVLVPWVAATPAAAAPAQGGPEIVRAQETKPRPPRRGRPRPAKPAAGRPAPGKAAPAVAPKPAGKPRPAATRPKQPEPPPVEPSPVTLRVVEDGPALHWLVQVKNEADVPARLVADPHLLWFEVKVPGKAKKSTCRLPDSLFPKKPDEAANVELRPGDSVVHRFDPRLYCFSEKGQWQLVPGAQITPHFGWPQKTRTRYKQGKRVEEAIDEPPYALRVLLPGPVPSGEEPKDKPAKKQDEPGKPWKEIVGTTFALNSSYAEWAITRLPEDETEAPLALTLTHGSDADFERNTSVSLKLKNQSKEAMDVFFRRELVSFEVMGPDGLRQCDAAPDDRAPDRGGFSRLGRGESMTIGSRLVELCPRGTFAYPGLYLINARFDARESGEEYDIDAFIGRVIARSPVTVRISKGDEKLNLGGMALVRAQEQR